LVKLLRYGPRGRERPGLLDGDGHIRDLSGHIDDITPEVLAPDRLRVLATLDSRSLPQMEGSVRLGPPVAGVGKIIAVGFNYASHAQETAHELPKEPLLFSKAVTALSGPNDPVLLPRDSVKTDWEVELAVVIGRRALYAARANALDYVAGYAIMNDVSERTYQLEGTGQFLKGKSFDSFAPFGPWLVTKDEVPDPQRLKLWLDVNGRRRQDSTTADMIFGVAYLVSYISRFMTLMPGDVIATGTPPGVGLGHKPPIFLKPGDTMRLGIEGLGEQSQTVVAFDGQPSS
jgi:2-keto-4-pentenoate hydratase/2-oxohepta-3-ene-1,7-dioic acid hydratase in catechol pathway